MKQKNNLIAEETLDPTDWTAFKKLGHTIIDDVIDYLQTVKERKVWQPMPQVLRDEFQSSVPKTGAQPQQVYEDTKRLMFQHAYGNIHPRFWAWINSPGTIMGVFAELIANTINSNCIYGDHSAIYIETQVLNWIKELFSLPLSYSGILVSGGSMANLHGLTVARNSHNELIRKKGLKNQELIIYCSKETHNSVDKAIELLGLGRNSIRKIQTNNGYTIDLDKLNEAIQYDKNQGLTPFCIVGNAGTVNTGAVDPLNSLADICERENIWFHIDGAYGLLAYLVDTEKNKLEGFERADSLAFDLHKWMYINYSAGCVLFKSKEKHINAFALPADYLMDHKRGLRVGGGPNEFNHLGIELTRPNRALKIWMSLKEHGVGKYAMMINKDIELANYLKELVEQNEVLELMAPVSLSIVCFRFNPGKSSIEELNTINKELLMDLQESGMAIISSTFLDHNYVLRAAITNHRSTFKDIDILIDSIIKITKV